MFDPRPYLERLDSLIDPRCAIRAEERQAAAWRFESCERVPVIVSCNNTMAHKVHDLPPDWPLFRYREQLADPGKMLVNELTQVYEGVLLKDDRVFTVRANFGCVIIPSILGIQFEQRDDGMPWTEPLESAVEVRNLIDRGVGDMKTGLGARAHETEQYFLEMLGCYPKLRKTVHIACPDTQGPFNLASSIMGPSIYVAMYDEPELVHALLELVTDAYIGLTWLHKHTVGEPRDVGYQMSWRLDCGARVVDDAATNISSRMYREFCVPYNMRVAEAFGGALGHFCGDGRQIFEPMLITDGIRGMHFGNPELQDFRKVYDAASARRICVLWDGRLSPDEADVDTGLIWKRVGRNWEEARKVAMALRDGSGAA